MDRAIDIAAVARATGLTARALRFYEARGLVWPLRTASGRRLYGPGELQRLNQLVVLKAARMPMGGAFDADAYNRQWAELASRIAAALPLDPASAPAQAYLAEWQALLVPFTAVATPEMMAGAAKVYDRMSEWQAEQPSPFPMEVWTFIKAAGAARAEAARAAQRVGTGSAPE